MPRVRKKSPLEIAGEAVLDLADTALAQVKSCNDIICDIKWIDKRCDGREHENARLCASVYRRNAAEAEDDLRHAVRALRSELGERLRRDAFKESEGAE